MDRFLYFDQHESLIPQKQSYYFNFTLNDYYTIPIVQIFFPNTQIRIKSNELSEECIICNFRFHGYDDHLGVCSWSTVNVVCLPNNITVINPEYSPKNSLFIDLQFLSVNYFTENQIIIRVFYISKIYVQQWSTKSLHEQIYQNIKLKLISLQHIWE